MQRVPMLERDSVLLLKMSFELRCAPLYNVKKRVSTKVLIWVVPRKIPSHCGRFFYLRTDTRKEKADDTRKRIFLYFYADLLSER